MSLNMTLERAKSKTCLAYEDKKFSHGYFEVLNYQSHLIPFEGGNKFVVM